MTFYSTKVNPILPYVLLGIFYLQFNRLLQYYKIEFDLIMQFIEFYFKYYLYILNVIILLYVKM